MRRRVTQRQVGIVVDVVEVHQMTIPRLRIPHQLVVSYVVLSLSDGWWGDVMQSQ